MLGLTADNTSNMDKMSEYLEREVAAYSTVNRTRCFNHILSLTGKALLKQFDVKKQGDEGNDSNKELSAEEKELLALSAGIDDEELAMADEMMAETEEDDRLIDEDLNELDEWIDEVSNEMTDEERLVLAANIRPVSCVLVKVFNLLTGNVPC
jgi:cob(I)alamin adenosyltransferase